MSSILKALEKAEESHSTRRDGGPGGFKKPRERRPAWVIPVAVLGGAAVAALATFGAMGGFSRSAAPVAEVKKEAAPVSAVAPSQATPAALQATPVPLPEERAAAPAPAPEPAVTVAVPVPKAEPVPVPESQPLPVSKPAMEALAKRVTGVSGRVVRPAAKRPVATAPAAPASSVPSVAAVKPAVAREPAPAPVQAAPVVAPAVPATPATPATPAAPAKAEKSRPDIRVTGIAWQKDSASSGAIVNGRMLQQGGTVEGYRIEQIHEDKVTFSGPAGKLEVPLGAGE